MRVSPIITEKIIEDNEFSLELALFLNDKGLIVKQLTLEMQAKRNSNKLLHPLYMEFYKIKGYGEEEIIEKPVEDPAYNS